MDLHRNFLFRMMILDIHLSGCSVYQKPFLNMYGSTRRYNVWQSLYDLVLLQIREEGF